MLFLALSFISFQLRTLSNKEFTRSFSGLGPNLLFNAIGLSVTFIISLLTGGMVRPETGLLILAAIFGLLFAATVIVLLFAYGKGPLGPVSLVYHMSTFVPIIFSFTLFHEPLTWKTIVGLCLVLIVFILSSKDSEVKDEKKNGKASTFISPKVWMPITIAATLMNGTLAALQNMATQWFTADIMVFNFWSYLIGAAALWIALIVYKLTHHDLTQVKEKPVRFSLISLLCGLFASGGNIFIMYALSKMPSSIAFPLNSVLANIVTYLISLFYYKEGRSKYGIPMLIIGGVCIFLLSLA